MTDSSRLRTQSAPFALRGNLLSGEVRRLKADRRALPVQLQYLNGANVPQLMKRFGISQSTVYRFLKRDITPPENTPPGDKPGEKRNHQNGTTQNGTTKTEPRNVVRKPENETDYHQKPQNGTTFSKTEPLFSLALSNGRKGSRRKQANADLEQARTEAIRLAHKVKRTGNHFFAWECGAVLQETKELTPFGEFGPWLEKDFPYTSRTARKYMTLARMAWAEIVRYDSIRSALASLPAKPARSAKEAETLIAELQDRLAALERKTPSRRQLQDRPPDQDTPPPEDDTPVKLFTRGQFDVKQIQATFTAA